MKKIALIGAGRSATVLIEYLLDVCEQNDWYLTIADLNVELANSKSGGHPRALALAFDASSDEAVQTLVQKHDFIVSMLPAHMHLLVAQACVQYKKSMATASYISQGMSALHEDAVAAGITLVNEIGLDPGIDHLSAMEVLDRLRSQGAEIEGFESYCGGLVAPASDTNPWGYKFSWNPRNVILAGQGGAARYMYNGEYKYLPYQRLFQDITKIEIEGHGFFEGYANRDSLGYRTAYGLQSAATVYRGTLRKSGYSAAWNVFVQLGMTDDSYLMENASNMNAADFLSAFLPGSRAEGTLRNRLMNQTQFHITEEIADKIEWLGFFREDWYPVQHPVSPAVYLQTILEDRWKLMPGDRDMIVMWHRFVYTMGGKRYEKHAWLVHEGKNEQQTAMAATVGLPLGITVKLILTGKITSKGVLLPVTKDIYTPVLEELETFRIRFEEKDIEI